MKNPPFKLLIATALLLGAGVCLPAQTATKTTSAERDFALMTGALKLREDLTAAVAGGRETPVAAIARLKASATSSGLNLPGEANLALAAIDVGHRLIALHQPAEAEEFFKAAEGALVAAAKLADASNLEKVRYLQQLASIRAEYLGAPAQAKADIEAAIALRPDDEGLRTTRRLIAGGNREIFREQSNR